MRRPVLALFAPALAAALFVPTTASALHEVCSPFTLEELRTGMDALEKAMADYDLNEARYQAEIGVKNARCVNEPMPTKDLARLARLRAMMYFLDQKSDDAASWMMVFLSVEDPAWPEDMGPMHPLRIVLQDVEEPSKVKFDGNAVPPPKGFILFNGRLMQQPQSYENVLGLVQIFDKKGVFVDGFWVDGINYTSEVQRSFVASGAPEYATKAWKGETVKQAPDLVKALAAATSEDDDPMMADDDDLGIDIPATADPTPPETPKDPEPKPKDPDPVDGDDKTPTSTDDDGAADVDTTPPTGTGDGDGDGDGDGGTTKKPKDPKPPKEPKPEKEPKPPKEPKPAKPPKAPKDPSAKGGISAGRLSTGLGLMAVSGGLYGVAYATSTARLPDDYKSSTLASRRTMVNGMVLGSAVAGIAGLGLGVSAFIDHDGGGVGFHTRW